MCKIYKWGKVFSKHIICDSACVIGCDAHFLQIRIIITELCRQK